jgi:ribosomal protein S18 acetylase RimI-like enzyme
MENLEKNIEIRTIGESDIELLTTYRLAYLTELQGDRPAEYKERLKSELNTYFKEAVAQGRCFALMAVEDNTIVSFGAMVIKSIPGDFNKSSYLEGDILNMYTIPQARRRGISAMILEHLIEEARSRGISKISLHTSKDGERLYRKYNFSEPTYPVLELCL